MSDNYFAALNSAVFSDGSFVYLPKGVRSPMELSTYFRINASETGQVSAHSLCVPRRTGAGRPAGRRVGVWADGWDVAWRVGVASRLPTC